ncbi:hypothetical protein CYMTET_43837 [Cymbomonas tetramitiformis]|uniref:Uncharacterized protein n=1 Tax=Cymbomonas tetramitiformis TaxID=36881 RepID=A0AAE0C1D9_9CHLO|nr:hypothetical protein CYMTET_43837 [Cymbomonas tetramitiformis]
MQSSADEVVVPLHQYCDECDRYCDDAPTHPSHQAYPLPILKPGRVYFDGVYTATSSETWADYLEHEFPETECVCCTLMEFATKAQTGAYDVGFASKCDRASFLAGVGRVVDVQDVLIATVNDDVRHVKTERVRLYTGPPRAERPLRYHPAPKAS